MRGYLDSGEMIIPRPQTKSLGGTNGSVAGMPAAGGQICYFFV